MTNLKYFIFLSAILGVVLGSKFDLYCLEITFEENTVNVLFDGNTYDYCKLPQNFLLEHIYIKSTSSTLTPNVTIAIGYWDNNEAYIPFSYGLNSDIINQGNVIFTPTGLTKGVTIDQSFVTLIPTERLSGQLELFIRGQILPF